MTPHPVTRSAGLTAAGFFFLACSATSSPSPAAGDGLPASSGGLPSFGGQGTRGGTGGGAPSTSGTSPGGELGAGGVGTGGTPEEPVVLSPFTIFVAGDSTVSSYPDTASEHDQAGWGQMLPLEFSELVTVDNRAIGGRTAFRFSLEGGVAQILEDAKPGDYLFIQFGTNDGNTTATFTFDGKTYPFYAAAGTDFKKNLEDLFVVPARDAGMIPVFVTPPPRNSAYCGKGNSLGGYAQAMRELGDAIDVPTIDLNARVFAHLAAICPSPNPEDFFLVRPDATVDGTHFQENGARQMAAFVASEIASLDLAIEPYLVP